MIKTPKFWLKTSLISLILSPFSLIYWIVFIIKKKLTKEHKISKKIICIGNLTAGGSGKTPTAIAIGKILKNLQIDFAYLSRGYGGSNRNVMKLIKEEDYESELTGDEPLILKNSANTYISKNRVNGAIFIDKNDDCLAIILDDGYQNNSLHKDFNILVIDGKYGFGNRFLLPAGPLRQDIKSGLKQADLIITIGEINNNLLKILPKNKVIESNVIIRNIENYQNQNFLAFCGIGYPQKFFDLLIKNKINLIKKIEYPDHYQYKIEDLDKIYDIAKKNNLAIITTEKDWIKFPNSYQEKIKFLEIELIFSDPQLIEKKILSIFNNR